MILNDEDTVINSLEILDFRSKLIVSLIFSRATCFALIFSPMHKTVDMGCYSQRSKEKLSSELLWLC